MHDADTNINDDIGIKLTLFVDYTSILITGKDMQDLTLNLDRTIRSILPWFENNRLIVNKDKSLALGFHDKLNKHIVFPDIILKDRQITYVSETKFLGVWLGHNLNWDLQVKKLVIKLSQLCYAVKTIKSFVNKNLVKTMYFAYMHSFLKYGILFWRNAKNLRKVFKIQKRAIRLIANISNTSSCKPYFQKLQIMTLPCIYILEILTHTKGSVSNFKTNSMFHSHDTRNKADLFIASHNTKLFEQSTAYNGVCIYNKLPSEIKSVQSIRKFKKLLSSFLLGKSFYSVEEFMTVDF
jgi:hypothetical protein